LPRRVPMEGLALLAGSLLLALAVFEVGARLAVQPSDLSWGRLVGVELMPRRLLASPTGGTFDGSRPYYDLVVDGVALTYGDVGGLIREDPDLGYVSLEDTASENGWWISNNVGARARTETTVEGPTDGARILVFGDSFSHGSHVRQTESWPYVMQAEMTRNEVVNLAVDGYGMAQAFLRYRQIRDLIDHDVVVLGFVPRDDLKRDVNTLRSLMGWESALVMPRFVLDGDTLRLVSSPFENAAEVARAAREAPQRIHEHLARYDAFYFEDDFVLPPVLGRSVAYKLAAGVRSARRRRALSRSMMSHDSEALRTTRAIVRTMAQEVERRGQRFVLVYIPNAGDVDLYRRDPTYPALWFSIVDFCPGTATCLDLMSELPSDFETDRGVDGSHYGPRTNAWIGSRVGRAITDPDR
jgi:hypothetical protein